MVLTRDKDIRRKSNELRAFQGYGVIGFVLTSGDSSAADTAAPVTAVYPELIRKIKGTKPLAMFPITLAGAINPIKL